MGVGRGVRWGGAREGSEQEKNTTLKYKMGTSRLTQSLSGCILQRQRSLYKAAVIIHFYIMTECFVKIAERGPLCPSQLQRVELGEEKTALLLFFADESPATCSLGRNEETKPNGKPQQET